MDNLLKKGDRVNIEVKIKEHWQSKYGCKNALIVKVYNKTESYITYQILVDDKTKEMSYHNMLDSGFYCTLGYKINKA